MNNLIIDTAGEKIFFIIIANDKEYSITHDNSRENFDILVKLVFNFLEENNLHVSKIDNVFINQGPGKYTSIRSALSLAKALKVSNKLNIYGYYKSRLGRFNDNVYFFISSSCLGKKWFLIVGT